MNRNPTKVQVFHPIGPHLLAADSSEPNPFHKHCTVGEVRRCMDAEQHGLHASRRSARGMQEVLVALYREVQELTISWLDAREL